MSTEAHLLFSFVSDLLKLMLNLNLLDHLEVIRIYTAPQFLMSEKHKTLFFKKICGILSYIKYYKISLLASLDLNIMSTNLLQLGTDSI